MKVYLIKASAPGPFKKYKKNMGAPPQNIFSVAATTPDSIDLALCDETIDMKPDYKIKADLVAIFFHTPDAAHSYKMAEKFRSRGYTVVLGGLHASFMSGEAGQYADSVLIGEPEGIWEQLLKDFANNSLKPCYKREKPVDMAILRPYPTDLIPPSKYNYFWSVLVSRGCVHKCDFCTVPEFFCRKYRVRPVENIVAEIEAAPPGCWFELHADNLTADREYALKLFKALKPLNIKWMGEATIKLAEDEELLRAAAESGCKGLLIGIETPSADALEASGKGFVSPDILKEQIKKFHKHGISITSSIIFGFDNHNKDIFQKSLDFCRYIEIDEVESVILIPFPGTDLYRRLKAEGRILTDNWSLYDGNNVVFKPANMSAEELKDGSVWFWTELRRKKTFHKKAPRGSGSAEDSAITQKGADKTPALTTGLYRPVRWKSILALGFVGLGIYLNIHWIWGVIFIIWALTDIKNGTTYFMDDIPRKESPVLYWLVILMWLGSGIMAISTTPVSYRLVNIFKAPPSKIFKQPSKVRKATDKELNFSVTTPVDWKETISKTDGTKTHNFRHPENLASLDVIVVDFNYHFPLKDFIRYMENELGKNDTVIKSDKGVQLKEFYKTTPSAPRPEIREYSGEYSGYPSKVIVGYYVQDNRGYTIIATHSASDYYMRSIIQNIFSSFTLTHKDSVTEGADNG